MFKNVRSISVLLNNCTDIKGAGLTEAGLKSHDCTSYKYYLSVLVICTLYMYLSKVYVLIICIS